MRLSPHFQLLIGLLLFCIGILYVNLRVAQLSSPSGAPPRAVSSRRPSIVFYNRIPKTGSTTFTNAVAYDLYKINNFNVVHLNLTKNRQVMSLFDQSEMVRNVSEWTDRHPLFLHGHAAYIDFERFNYPPPIYINIVREPLERLLSHYYFLRYGDNYRVGLKRSRAGNNETFDECIARSGHDCDVKQMWLQIPYFCGHHHFCSQVGNKEALETAKRNLKEKYLLVGTTDRIREMIAILDRTLPEFFRGALNYFDSLDENRAHLRNTQKKIPPSQKTLFVVRSTPVYQMERNFYEFALEEFESLFKKASNGTSDVNVLMSLPRQYHYEKIKPAQLK